MIKHFLLLIFATFILFSCNEKIISGKINYEVTLPKNMELTFNIVNSDDNEIPINVKVNNEGNFYIKINDKSKGIRFKLSKFFYIQGQYNDPVLADTYDSKIIKVDNLTEFYFFDSNRNIILINNINLLHISWKIVPFENTFYSIRILDSNRETIKEIYTKADHAFIDLKKGDVNSYFHDIISSDFTLPMIVKNNELAKGDYKIYLTIFIRNKDYNIITLSIQEVDVFINDKGDFIIKEF